MPKNYKQDNFNGAEYIKIAQFAIQSRQGFQYLIDQYIKASDLVTDGTLQELKKVYYVAKEIVDTNEVNT